MKFCANPLCQFHLETEDGNRLEYRMADKLVRVRQMVICDSATGAQHLFCEVCANAVAIANEQPKTNKE